LKKAPGRTEFQRGILQLDERGAWSVRVTGEQGSGILRSMAEANCFIILPDVQGNVASGTLVEVQPMEGVV
jgi:molybdopterin molybdotransferase